MATPEPTLPTAVVSALKREIAPLLSRARLEARIATSRGRFARVRLGPCDLVLGWTGDGRRSADEGLRALLSRHAVDRLVFLGVAGGLAPDLETGALVATREVRDAEGPAPPPDRDLVERALAAGGGSTPAAGLIYTSEHIVGTAAGKAELWRALGEPAGAVVDLETAAWAHVAGERDVPYVAVRAVSDPAGRDLPLDFERFRDARGRVKVSRVALRAVLEPALIGPLRELEQCVDRCAARLASWTISFLA